jgi:subtilisin family serine protease
VLIRLKSIQDYPLLVNSIATYNIQSVNLCDFDERTYQLTIDKSSNKNAMQIANELYETEMFEYAEPNLIHFIKFETNDTHFPDQWALNNTGQYGGTVGIDIKANQAWTITTGSPDVRIAILDLGVDLTHPDLQANLLTGFDATGGSGNGAAVNNIAHGTACAGIAAAIGNNNKGIAGVAYGCKILPVRIATTTSGWTSAESQYIASGINWARSNGASVISMSFTCVETNVLNTAISNAINYGRNNNGCVLVAAAGNSNVSSVSYPARHADVIAVGAISPCGERKSYSSCDGESWGSNYGTNLDVVAPGVKIYTTDIQSSAGYNQSNGTAGNYYASFNGTSAACPHVAGIAALILSVNPNLTQAQVRQAIESTCTKLPGYGFSNDSNHPNETWNEEVGHGLVNAYAALQALPPTILGSSIVPCDGYATYTSNISGTWTVSSNLQIVSGQGTHSIRVQRNSGTSTVNNYATVSINGLVTKEITFSIPPPVTAISGPGIAPNGILYFSASPSFSASVGTYEWIVFSVGPGANGAEIIWQTDNYLTAKATKPANYYVFCQAVGLCTGYFQTPIYKTFTVTQNDLNPVTYSMAGDTLATVSDDYLITSDGAAAAGGRYSVATGGSKQVNVRFDGDLSAVKKDIVDYMLVNPVSGAITAKGKMPSSGGMLSFDNAPSGVYIFMIDAGNKQPESFKILLR